MYEKYLGEKSCEQKRFKNPWSGGQQSNDVSLVIEGGDDHRLILIPFALQSLCHLLLKAIEMFWVEYFVIGFPVLCRVYLCSLP